MKELSVTQQYLICALNENGKLSGDENLKSICLVISGLLELRNGGFIEEKNGTVICKDKAMGENSYLQPLYQSIHNSKKVTTMEEIVTDYVVSITGKKFNTFFHAIGNSLVDCKCAVLKNGILRGSQFYLPDKECKEDLSNKIRVVISEEREVSKEMLTLIYLLEKSESLKQLIPKEERKQVKVRVNELKTATYLDDISKIVDHVFAKVVACAVVK